MLTISNEVVPTRCFFCHNWWHHSMASCFVSPLISRLHIVIIIFYVCSGLSNWYGSNNTVLTVLKFYPPCCLSGSASTSWYSWTFAVHCLRYCHSCYVITVHHLHTASISLQQIFSLMCISLVRLYAGFWLVV
jgi:hypothetical protein